MIFNQPYIFHKEDYNEYSFIGKKVTSYDEKYFAFINVVMSTFSFSNPHAYWAPTK